MEGDSLALSSKQRVRFHGRRKGSISDRRADQHANPARPPTTPRAVLHYIKGDGEFYGPQLLSGCSLRLCLLPDEVLPTPCSVLRS